MASSSVLLILAAAGIAAGLDLPVLGRGTSDQLDSLVGRAEKLVDGLSMQDLEQFQSNAEASHDQCSAQLVNGRNSWSVCHLPQGLVSEGRKHVKFAVQFARANQRLLELAAGGLMVFCDSVRDSSRLRPLPGADGSHCDPFPKRYALSTD